MSVFRYNLKMKEQIQTLLKEVIKNTFNIEIDPQLDIPKDKSHGDFSTNAAMVLAKQAGKSPREIAEAIISALSDEQWVMGKPELAQSSKLIAHSSVAGPGFINFKIATGNFRKIIDEILQQKETFGKGTDLKDKIILIEHTSPNPNKELHLGHLKNNVTGLSISYLFEAEGARVFRDCIDNNRGIAIARLMWGYLKFAKKDESIPTELGYWFDHKDQWYTPQEKNITPGKFVDDLYTKGSEDTKNNSESEQIVRQLVIDWESEDQKNWTLWKLTQDWVWNGYEQSLGRVNGWKFDHIWHEHELYKKGKEHVDRGIKEGYFKKLDDGAVLTDFKKQFGIPDTILIKNDGTSLYITQDLELTKQKREKFNPDKMMWVIGPEQSLAMKQMFAACSQLGFGNYEDFHHIPYGFILIKNKEGKPEKMSSRKGTQIHVNDLIDKAKEDLKQYIKVETLTSEEVEEITEKVAIAAIKYSLLKVTRTQDMVFDYETSISLEGDSGPYIMYSYARAKSILREAKVESNEFKIESGLDSEEEVGVLKLLSLFPEKVSEAAREYAPSIVANYLYDVAQSYNKFYNTHSVLKAESEDVKQSRLALTQATAQVLKNGLGLLGIETVEKM